MPIRHDAQAKGNVHAASPTDAVTDIEQLWSDFVDEEHPHKEVNDPP